MTTLVSLVAAAEGRYVAAARELEAAWHIYVAWESAEPLRRRNRWWHASAAWDAPLAAAIERAWHSPHLHVQLLDYDTPDEDAASVPLLAELSLLHHATADAAHTRQAAMEQALQAAQAALDAERAKYRELLAADRVTRATYSSRSLTPN
ncbi:hypothetical protein MCAP1_000830 [Malassezia caprae]|uniref:Uncharacterized protein n=1 Tax=Malassezia caprae TaxID=1381934 RepID=A0AAF0IUC0_9BASI|nr:hypothetical protein MCAP1_000830 [Malassezia caprae]